MVRAEMLEFSWLGPIYDKFYGMRVIVVRKIHKTNNKGKIKTIGNRQCTNRLDSVIIIISIFKRILMIKQYLKIDDECASEFRFSFHCQILFLGSLIKLVICSAGFGYFQILGWLSFGKDMACGKSFWDFILKWSKIYLQKVKQR